MGTTQVTDIATLDKQLNDAIINGTALDAFEAMYADNIVMQENAEEPRVGKAANLAYEKAFFANLEAFHGAKVLASAVSGNHSFSEWWMDVSFKGGNRVQMTQVAVRQWKDGKVFNERFYHKS